MPTPATLYAQRIAAARTHLAELSAALDADEARIAERVKAGGTVTDLDAAMPGYVVRQLGELIRFLTV